MGPDESYTASVQLRTAIVSPVCIKFSDIMEFDGYHSVACILSSAYKPQLDVLRPKGAAAWAQGLHKFIEDAATLHSWARGVGKNCCRAGTVPYGGLTGPDKT